MQSISHNLHSLSHIINSVFSFGSNGPESQSVNAVDISSPHGNVGLGVGLNVGLPVGLSVGLSVGLNVGLSVGLSVGLAVGVCPFIALIPNNTANDAAFKPKIH